jgi:hypothetical protein
MRIADQVITLHNGQVNSFQPEDDKIIAGLPDTIYHGPTCSDYESSTTVKKIRISLKHRFDMEFKQTSSMRLGSTFHDVVHCMKSGTDMFDRYRVVDCYPRNRKEPIVQWIHKYYPLVHGIQYPEPVEDMLELSKVELMERAADLEVKYLNGKEKVTNEHLDTSQAMLTALKGHPVTFKLLKLSGLTELSFFCSVPVYIDDEQINVKVKIRPDLLTEFPDEIWLSDWKTIGVEATDRNIKKQIRTFGYDLSVAMYMDVLTRFTEKPVYFRLIFVEKDKPSKEKVRVIQLDPLDIEDAHDNYMDALMKKAQWIKDQKTWLGFPISDTGIDTISLRNHY